MTFPLYFLLIENAKCYIVIGAFFNGELQVPTPFETVYLFYDTVNT